MSVDCAQKVPDELFVEEGRKIGEMFGEPLVQAVAALHDHSDDATVDAMLATAVAHVGAAIQDCRCAGADDAVVGLLWTGAHEALARVLDMACITARAAGRPN